MKRFFLTFGMLFLLALTMSLSPFLFSMVQVGEVVQEKFESAHPYKGVMGVVWEQEFHWPEAGYIAIHFTEFNLAKGDYLEISSPDGRFYYTFSEKGKKVKHRDRTEEISEFWATHIPGDTAIVKLVSKNKNSGYGFVIDKWAHGYERGYIEAVMSGLEDDAWANVEAICSSDDKEWAKCYEGTEMYNKARAVCRLLIGGSGACTGWLLGSEGHVMTNNHCISTQSSASNTDYEFMAEGATCSTSCASWGACPGTVEASSGTMIRTDSALDYTLILLPTNITGTYGYLQLRDTLPSLDERIYIPQHPSAWGKQLAVLSDTDGPYARIYSTNESPCSGGPGDIGYYADTAGGSSGSPVLAYNDNLVVALHHCADCPNRGVPIPAIISHLGPDLPNNAIYQTPTITVISPKSGSNWKIGNKYTITWNSSNVTGNVRIQLFKGSSRLGNITNNTANDGRFAWTIGTLTNGYQVKIPGSDYRVKIRSVNDSTIWDFSGYFTISEAPKIAIVDKNPPTFGHTVDKGTIITDTFRVKNIGGGTLNFSISDDRTWISVSPASGSCTSEQKSGIITVTITTSGLAYGSDNTGTITVSDPKASNSPQTISVTVSIRDLVKCKLYRYLNSSIGDHYYTTNWNELKSGAGGYVYEGVACYVCGSQQPGTVPLYRYLNNTIGDHFYTTNWNTLKNGAGGYVYEGIACWVHNSQQPGTKKFYRYLNSSIGDHYYTTNWNELGNGAGGYVYEGVACFVY